MTITEMRAAIDVIRLRWPTVSLLLVACALFIAPAEAHRSAPPQSTSGLVLPSVSHGQMAVLSAYRADVLDLAGKVYPTDSDMRRLQTFISLQYFSCAWGLIPGGVSNEDSPFNECTHAYLAGVRALLLHLETMPGDRRAVRVLRRRIDTAMLETHASLVLCRFSEEPFNTAEIVTPKWSEMLTDAQSLAALAVLAFGAALTGGVTSMLARGSRAEPMVSA